jgi:hypothetical protein
VVEEAQVTVGGCAAPPSEEGLTFGVVGDIHIRVCMSNSGGLRDVCCSPVYAPPPANVVQP